MITLGEGTLDARIVGFKANVLVNLCALAHTGSPRCEAFGVRNAFL